MQIRASYTYRCRRCTQLLPFDETRRVPEACLRRCEGACNWYEVGPTAPEVRARAEKDGPLDEAGLPKR